MTLTPRTGSLIVGSSNACKEYLRANVGHYVYILRRPDGRPFYVGKGVGDRVFQHENEARHPNGRRSNAHKLNVIRSIWRDGGSITYEIDFVHAANEMAVLARETELIGLLRRLHEGGPLTNRDPGGGSSGIRSPFSVERHSATLSGVPVDNPERAILNQFVLNIGPMRSVVLKPLGQFTPKPTLRYPGKSMGASLRQSIALAASASANGVSLDAACRIPRRVTVEGIDGFVENGVSCDVLTSGMATVLPAGRDAADEVFELTANQAQVVTGYVGIRKCIDLGILRAAALKQVNAFGKQSAVALGTGGRSRGETLKSKVKVRRIHA